MRSRRSVWVGIGAVVLALTGRVCQGENFYGREPFELFIPWGREVSYLALTQSADELTFVTIGMLTPDAFFGAALRGLAFGDAFLGQSDEAIVRSYFTLSRNEHIEKMSVAYEPVFARETTLGGRFAVMEGYIEKTSQDLVLRGYSVAFGDRHVCFFLQISTSEADFSRARDALDQILAETVVGISYPALVTRLPLTIELDGEQLPLVMSALSANPPSATVSWEDRDLSLRATATELVSADAAAVLADMSQRMTTDAPEGDEYWSTSTLSIDGLRVELQITEVEATDGAWTKAVVAWSADSYAFLVEYKRFTFDYRDDHIAQIVRAFHRGD